MPTALSMATTVPNLDHFPKRNTQSAAINTKED